MSRYALGMSAPPDWVHTKVGRVVDMRVGWTPPTNEPKNFDGPHLWANISDLGNRFIADTAKRVSSSAMTAARMTEVPAGSLLFSFKLSVGLVSFAQVPMCTNEAIASFLPSSTINLRYAFYALPLFVKENAGTNIYGAKILNQQQILAAPVVLPPKDEQRLIADYLDRETAEIDAFIADQEELTALMEERRDSAWQRLFESVDAHSKRRLGQIITSIVDGPFGSSLTSAHYSDSGTRVIRLGNLGINEFRDEDKAFIPDSYARKLAKHRALEGDVLIAGLGDDRMPLGRAAVVPDIGPAIVKADVYRVRPRSGVLPAYLSWVLNAPPTRAAMMHLSRGSTRSRLNTSVVREVSVPIPSVDRQAEMLRRDHDDKAPIDAAIADARAAIALSRERRAALISAAVTGQVDVRERKRVLI